MLFQRLVEVQRQRDLTRPHNELLAMLILCPGFKLTDWCSCCLMECLDELTVSLDQFRIDQRQPAGCKRFHVLAEMRVGAILATAALVDTKGEKKLTDALADIDGWGVPTHGFAAQMDQNEPRTCPIRQR